MENINFLIQTTQHSMKFSNRILMATIGAVMLTHVFAQAPAQTFRVRGTIQKVDSSTLTVKAGNGEIVELQLPQKLPINEVFPIQLNAIQPGSYIGIAAMPMDDGAQKAIAITVFPEISRGTAEGFRSFDLLPQSTMTNATVSQVMEQSTGKTLTVKYKDGAKTVLVPFGTPVVTFKSGDAGLLMVGASVSLTAQMDEDKPTVLRLNAGRGGFVLPY
jgi:hypothetical protein